MKKQQLLVSVSVLLLSFSCDKATDHSYSLGISNKSAQTLVTTLSYSYPSLAMPDWATAYMFLRNLEPQSTTGYSVTHGFWADEIKRNSKDTMIVFFIKKDTLNKYGYNQTGYEAIRASGNIAGYKFVTKDNLDTKGQNASVNYP